MHRWLLIVLALAATWPRSAQAGSPPVRLMPATAASQPYVRAPLPPDYVQEEYAFLAWDSHMGDTGAYTVVNVRRPADPSRASGVVIVEPWHPGDLWPLQSTTQAYLARAGHTSVVVVSTRAALDILKRASPARYARRDEDEYLALPDEGGPDVLAQVAEDLRLGTFPNVKPRWLILGGYSNTAAQVREYIVSVRPRWNRRLYDGYLVGQQAVGTRPQPMPDIDVPVIEIQGESELIRTFTRGGDRVGWRRPDGRNFRLYEVPGLAHLNSRDEGNGDPIRWRCRNPVRSQYPHRQAWSAILALLVRWVDKGVPAPHAPRIETRDAGRTIVRDAHGHAKGGVRSVALDVPVAAITAVGERGPGDPESARCDMVGWQRPLDPVELKRLYGDHAGYVRKAEARLAELVRQGWLLPEDAKALAAEARTAKVP